ncbi:alkanesulfonate monooxygenase SsuD/methylene tetrahydromethanopterin reductase-like flavin-dependent oxidoreductase (luciferase family) [Paenarthrobacter nicotinovorans]|uniref:LLM class flavin-dependent oxidoreductase n=1 Tax=Micrococcaceae TaxID=1268 RepID=UPI00087613A2|nr:MULTISPECIES: LLM class flavin-dependent oxidoreductase [Micrococcaceae]MDR6438450.1 alkanesulfonate monooxygenase SsuD/methylene tetrahydromethanopterin reductase-like flavin-dependent oxidoreductase (luciferase family) [Paenarthrobacter nicotinovorans]SCZ64111.1 Flavin-dependent oxidoreductase, luciferase family (includes alkanesulfonate monooxygenase SsuD and methylene tetrahydromethanopterin reductase) [Arthrobacter sp. UNCCL28]
MPTPEHPLRKLGFLTIGLFDPADPAAGHRSTLEIIELGERLGFDSAWLRHRHLQFGISSPVAVMAAASQRTSRIELGTAVTPLGWENPLRLAEDLATVDLLSGGRINPGLSVGEPMNYDTVKHELYPDTADVEDFSYARVNRLARLVAGEKIREFSGKQGVVEEFSHRVEPHSPGLRARLWYGAASMKSAVWAGENGFNLLSSSVIFPDKDQEPDFAGVQQSQIRAYREAAAQAGHPARVSQGLVVIPTDSASPDQRQKYQRYVDQRTPRTRAPQGPKGMMFAQDIIGTSEEIAGQLYAHQGFQEVDEVAFALPFSFEHEDYVQILTDIAEKLGPALGWTPAA